MNLAPRTPLHPNRRQRLPLPPRLPTRHRRRPASASAAAARQHAAPAPAGRGRAGGWLGPFCGCCCLSTRPSKDARTRNSQCSKAVLDQLPLREPSPNPPPTHASTGPHIPNEQALLTTSASTAPDTRTPCHPTGTCTSSGTVSSLYVVGGALECVGQRLQRSLGRRLLALDAARGERAGSERGAVEARVQGWGRQQQRQPHTQPLCVTSPNPASRQHSPLH